MNESAIEDGFIGMLLEETYKNVSKEESAAAPSDLYKYFDLKNKSTDRNESIESTLENHLSAQNIKIYEFKYQAPTACYRFYVNQMELDIPSNWSVFEQLHRSARLNESALLIINAENDYDALFNVLLPFAECKSDLILFVNNQKIYMAFIPEARRENIQWIKNYLELEDKLTAIDVVKAA
ncbi:MAG: hypothetical protein A2504_06215 [Bdellovibrionales bacterium RIFOXYD12_FULL_39_22]|nr:MAG: hypothetical protein A2385_08535 [Bdellovibrionales bacterium RIFOXYB1_FULL_39_21]OFZ45250.1 MAG: hypothetical protein A2485_06000 [Bdellovibrionales bacterium RIFOXYC12_FULL_39_17]OFZ45560.1 MAG: hypothetical protein A2404_03115 [Bdellovibrionales bacterium RIFOXYC1_FULL_39_130]OFZ74506.1 MAG: hypothetical protein A2451_08785 [Bdellovibrionales bacterium RIFOXYC2_FULL_39_8]OFZ77421.1 MAG: hypothetical protein A2560_08705 [Bdellovibrionales bacterium RIFOXYD1_FULL_39_84]OFZ91550.1 MAG: